MAVLCYCYRNVVANNFSKKVNNHIDFLHFTHCEEFVCLSLKQHPVENVIYQQNITCSKV